MEERRSYIDLFLLYVIFFGIGLISYHTYVLSAVSMAAFGGIGSVIQIKRGYVWGFNFREWIGRKDSPIIYWSIIAFQIFGFFLTLMLLEQVIALFYF
jgi:hypothetical protein